jgi:PEGA domain-containing protein
MSIDSTGYEERSKPLASWYTQGRSDGLGDRLLMADNSGTASLELLRFKSQFAATFGFEGELRERVEQLRRLQHPAFARIHGVEFLDDGEGLTLVSTHTAGRRLSSIAAGARFELHPGLATWLIGQLTAAIAELHGQGNKIAHGALSADRIVLTPDRRLVIVEHVLGSALAKLALPAARLWSELGVIVPPGESGVSDLDCRADVVQIGLIALSVLLGRRITPADYPDRLDALLDEFSSTAARWSSALAAPLRVWLDHALRTDQRGFRSARDARDGFRELPGGTKCLTIEGYELRSDELAKRRSQISRGEINTTRVGTGDLTDQGQPHGSRAAEPAEVVERHSSNTVDLVPRRRARAWIAPSLAALFALAAMVEGVAIKRLIDRRAAAASLSTTSTTSTPSRTFRLESSRPGEVVLVDGQQVGVTPMELTADAERHTIRIGHPDVRPLGTTADAPAGTSGAAPTETAPAARVEARAATVVPAVASRQRAGGLRLVSPVALQVLEGERVLGSSADGPLVTTPGRHELELVNDAVGFRARQTVDIEAGRITSLPVTLPDGRISINAMPWAQVWIDGNPVGDTPLAYLPLAVGDHEILLRHPQLGEHREMAVIRSGALTRVSATLSR